MTLQEASKILRSLQERAKEDGRAGNQTAMLNYFLLEEALVFGTDVYVVELAIAMKEALAEFLPS